MCCVYCGCCEFFLDMSQQLASPALYDIQFAGSAHVQFEARRLVDINTKRDGTISSALKTQPGLIDGHSLYYTKGELQTPSTLAKPTS